jgi:hypothetical protein
MLKKGDIVAYVADSMMFEHLTGQIGIVRGAQRSARSVYPKGGSWSKCVKTVVRVRWITGDFGRGGPYWSTRLLRKVGEVESWKD